jgi:hypothetical protein
MLLKRDQVFALHGLTALNPEKAPFLNIITYSPLVVQPSGNIVIGTANPSSAFFYLSSSIRIEFFLSSGLSFVSRPTKTVS